MAIPSREKDIYIYSHIMMNKRRNILCPSLYHLSFNKVK